MTNLAEEIKPERFEEDMDRIFGEKHTTLEDMFSNLGSKIDRYYCSSHDEMKQDLFVTGELQCESCFNEQFHYANEGLEDEVDHVES